MIDRCFAWQADERTLLHAADMAQELILKAAAEEDMIAGSGIVMSEEQADSCLQHALELLMAELPEPITDEARSTLIVAEGHGNAHDIFLCRAMHNHWRRSVINRSD